RSHEIGVRMALGARPQDIFKLIIGQGVVLGGIGLGIGLIVTLVLSRLISPLLFGISAADPWIYVTISAALMVVTITACYVPARKAARIDPVKVMRSE